MPCFSTESRDRLTAEIEAHNYQIVAAETWGHLAPKKNATYRGVIRFAVGCFGNDELNPTAIEWELKSRTEVLDSSPWFHGAIMELLQDLASPPYDDPLPESWPKVEAGGVYEWRGTFRNYQFDGVLRRLELV